MQKINIALCFDRKMYMQAGVLISSVLSNIGGGS
jgi:lipopolysaccharide biosynthesis glycosyltransferase